MENKCLYCQNPVDKKYCNIFCKTKYKNSQENKKHGFIKLFKVQCFKCEKIFEIEEREFLFPQKEKCFCSTFCVHSRIHSKQTIEKIRQSCKKPQPTSNKQCLQCKKVFYKKPSIPSIFCSMKCKNIYYSTTGIDLARSFW